MALFPIRSVGGLGIAPDLPPHDLPPGAWSSGRNVRFHDGSIERFPSFAVVKDTDDYAFPLASVVNIPINDGPDKIVLIADSFAMSELAGNTLSDVTSSSIVTAASIEQITSCGLGGMIYINRRDQPPVTRLDSALGSFEPMVNWNADWRAGSLRAYKDYLIAMDVTKGGLRYPGMFKWSTAAMGGAEPDTWDPTDPASLAGENIMNDVNPPLIDGGILRDSFVVYGPSQTIIVDYIGAPDIFAFRKAFQSSGMIAKNCFTEVNGTHFVFGSDDLYVHDGITKKSVTDGKIKRYVFDNIDRSNKHNCFVAHDVGMGEVYFCFPSNDPDLAWSSEVYCNAAAVFNYKEQTWTMIDLPNASAADLGSPLTLETYDSSVSVTYDAATATYASYTGNKRPMVLLASPGSSTHDSRLYVMDDLINPVLTYDIPDDVIADAFVLRDKLDLDEVTDIEGKKLIRKLLPQLDRTGGDASFSFRVGSSETIGTPTDLGIAYPFNPTTDYKIDVRTSQRYLALYFAMHGRSTGRLSGVDLDVIPISRR